MVTGLIVNRLKVKPIILYLSSMKSTKLSQFDVTMIVVSLVIGMGIFRTPVNVAATSTSVGMFFLAWVIGGIVALCGALTYAEIGSRFPVTGGYYKIFSHCYHPSIAFSINCIILVSNAASLAGVSLIGAEYISNVFFPDAANKNTIKLIISSVALILFYGVNLLGLKMSARIQNILTVIKIGLILLLIGAIFTVDTSASQSAIVPAPSGEHGIADFLKALGACLVAVSFTYGGYQQVINFGGEIKDAPSKMPGAIFMGIGIVMLSYLAINYAYYTVIGYEQLKESESIAAILAAAIFGSKGFSILSILLFLSVMAYVNVSLLSNPRVMYAMSEEGVLPAVFQRKTKSTQVMITSLTVFASLCIITLFYAKTFDEILSHTIFLDSIGMATSGATIFILRRRMTKLDDKNVYRMKLYPLMPLVFILTYTFIAISIAITTPRAAMVSALIFAGFFILYFLMTRFSTNKKNLPDE